MRHVLLLCGALALTLLCSLPVVAAPSPGPEGAAGRWPLSPRPAVVHFFDPPAVRWGSGHRGVDLAGRVGQQVRAALPGRVTFTGRIAGVGVVAVDHGGSRTTYQPVSATVERGDEVLAGARLGRLEWHGTHCLPAPCLHWGLLNGERYLDPLSLVGAAPRQVRLLPLDGTSLDSGVNTGPLATGTRALTVPGPAYSVLTGEVGRARTTGWLASLLSLPRGDGAGMAPQARG